MSPQINKLYINISSWGPGMCYQWQNISWLHKHSFPPHPSKTSTQILGLCIIFVMYIHIYTKFKVVYIAHQSKAQEKMLQKYIRCHEMHTPKGEMYTAKGTAKLCSKPYPLYSMCILFYFPLKREYVMHIDACVYTHIDLFVCIYIHRERERHTSS